MERSVMFLQSLLMLVVAIQEISACKLCSSKTTLELAICINLTVVAATPLSKEPSAGLFHTTVYKMRLNVLYRPGFHPMKESDVFELHYRHWGTDCDLVLEIGKEYYITGFIGQAGSFVTTNCDDIQLVFMNGVPDEHSLANYNLVSGLREPDCTKYEAYRRALV